MQMETAVMAALRQKGERFMSMFEDVSGERPSKRQRVAAPAGQDKAPAAIPKQEIVVDGLQTPSVKSRKNKPGPVNSSGNKRESTFDCKQSQKRAKRMFLSGRGDKVLPRDPGKVERQAEDERADLRELFNEVQMFGANGLQKLSRKAVEDDRLRRLHAKPEKRRRMPASIGRGIAAKEALEDKKALQEAIETGMVQQKGLGKKKSRQKEAQRRVSQDGLNEDGGAFRAGLLDARKLPGSGSAKKGRRTPSKSRN